MRNRDGDLVDLFVRDLDSIELPARERWHPAPRERSAFMKAVGYLATAAAIAAALVLALVWSFGQSANPVAAPPSRSASSSTSPSATAAPSATASVAASASTTITPSQPTAPATGTITGSLGYPAEMVPPLTVYAFNVNDPTVWYSTNTPLFGVYNGASPTPAPPAATWPPSGRGTYQLAVPPGTYYVLGYLDRSFLSVQAAGGRDIPVLYSRYTVDCMQATQGGPNSTPAPACAAQDHTLIRVTVRAGETISRIDMIDWYFQPQPGVTYPPRPTPR